MANYMARKRRPSDVLPKGTKILGDPRQPQGVVAGINHRLAQLEAKLTEARSDITYACGVINTMAGKLNAQAKLITKLEKRADDEFSEIYSRINGLHYRLAALEGSKPEVPWRNHDATLPNYPGVGKAAGLSRTSFGYHHNMTDEAARSIYKVEGQLRNAIEALEAVRVGK